MNSARVRLIGTSGCESGMSAKFISLNARSVRRFDRRSLLICAIIVSELASTGRRETSSFHALSTGKICIAATMASASVVLNRTELVTTGAGPRRRPAWLTLSAFADRTALHHNRTKMTFRRLMRLGGVERQVLCQGEQRR